MAVLRVVLRDVEERRLLGGGGGGIPAHTEEKRMIGVWAFGLANRPGVKPQCRCCATETHCVY